MHIQYLCCKYTPRESLRSVDLIYSHQGMILQLPRLFRCTPRRTPRWSDSRRRRFDLSHLKHQIKPKSLGSFERILTTVFGDAFIGETQWPSFFVDLLRPFSGFVVVSSSRCYLLPGELPRHLLHLLLGVIELWNKLFTFNNDVTYFQSRNIWKENKGGNWLSCVFWWFMDKWSKYSLNYFMFAFH